MAEPKLKNQERDTSDLSAADRAFLEHMGQAKGWQVDAGDTLVNQAFELKSISRRFVTRVLPILLLPILLLGFLAIAGLSLLGNEANDAADSTDQILIDHQQVVASELTAHAEEGADEVNDFLVDWFGRLVGVTNSGTSATEVSAQFTGQENVQVLFVDASGNTISSSHSETTLSGYADAEWFSFVQANDQFRPFVRDSEFSEDGVEIAALEFSKSLDDGTFARIRVPMTNLHGVLDAATDGVEWDLAIADVSSGVIIADTSIDHDPAVLYTIEAMSGEDTMFDEDAEANEINVIAERQASTAQALQGVSTTQFPFTDLEWEVQANTPLDSISTSLIDFQDTAEDVNERQRVIILGIGLIMVAAFAAAFFLLRTAAKQISEPVQKLSTQAQEAAEIGIPAVVEAARNSDELPELDEFSVETNDELAILAASLNTMQGAAVDLAAGQAQLRRQNVARTFVSLGRRNQNLLNRQLEFIEELEAQERDADTLENLFRLDHLATRMRRNAENLLVLAGEQTPRRWGKPIAVRDVLRAAASEIADYRRVRLGDIEDATVSGNLATDLSHLIAELLENAGSFSPPTAPIEVFGLGTDTHYRLAIVDQGIGMDQASLQQVNERLENPVDFADAPSAYLGLFVVGRLAQEMGVSVRLANADANGDGERRGTIAFIDLPNELLSQDIASAVPLDEKASEAVARRTDEVDAGQAGGVTASQVFEQPAEVEAAEQPVTAEPAIAETPAAPVTDETATVEEATTDAGFPKRAKGATSIKTEPDKFISDKPAVAGEAATEAAAPAAKADAQEATTDAGFPKRAKGATSIKTEPDKFISDKPAVAGDQPAAKRDPKMSAVALVNQAKAEARAAAAAETDDADPATEAAPAHGANEAAPAVETTEAGFPKRGENKSSSPLPAPTADTAPTETRKRNAEDVRNSLANYRAAVARGRGTAEDTEMPDAVTASAETND